MSKIFKPEINHKIENNKKVFYSSIKEEPEIRTTEREISLQELLSDRYLFNKTVRIITKNNEIVGNVAGTVSDRLVTMDGNHVKINDIERILLK